MSWFGGIEAGGTKFVCAVGAGPDELRAEARIATTAPEETLRRAVEFFRAAEVEHGRCRAFGIAAFGPLDLDPASATWGHLAATPKPLWSGADLVTPLRQAFGVPVAIDTDVQGAALAEHRWGAGRGCAVLVYITAGTGIGGAALRRGAPLHEHHRAEMGHVRCPRHPADTEFPGVCRFHGDCIEGLASGPAVRARWGKPLEELPPEHPAWEILGHYLGHLAAAVTLTLAPDRIVLGGGLFSGDRLFDATRRWLPRLLAGYPEGASGAGDANERDGYLCKPALAARSGVLGAIAMAQDLTSESQLDRPAKT